MGATSQSGLVQGISNIKVVTVASPVYSRGWLHPFLTCPAFGFTRMVEDFDYCKDIDLQGCV